MSNYYTNVMELLDKAWHLGCPHYENGPLPTVEIRSLERGDEKEMTFHRSEIGFITQGQIRLTFPGHPEKALCGGEFIFIPVGGVLRYAVQEKVLVLIVRLNKSMKLCAGSRIEELYRPEGTRQESSRGEIHPLKANIPLRHFLEGLNLAVLSGFSCRDYFDTKARELFILLKAYYPHEDLRGFFSPVLSPDTAFSEYVRENHHKYNSAKQLAGAMNMTPKLFSKKFVKVFAVPAREWMRREKALCIYSELHSGDKPFTQIADEYRFSSQSHLNKFCLGMFGKNPGEIRRREGCIKKSDERTNDI